MSILDHPNLTFLFLIIGIWIATSGINYIYVDYLTGMVIFVIGAVINIGMAGILLMRITRDSLE